MIWVGIVFFAVGFIINFFVSVVSDENSGIFSGTLLVCIGTVLITTSCYETNPSAMDVYQGKTTLEITYKNGIPVDSVVVFKDKEK